MAAYTMNRDALKLLLIKHEACKLKIYDDANGREVVPGYTLIGHPTVGIGRALDTQGISASEANILLDNDLSRVVSECRSNFAWFDGLCDSRQSVVASMVFNLGLKGFKEFSKMIAAIAKGEYAVAANEMLSSKWAGQVGRRATELAQMMRDGDPLH